MSNQKRKKLNQEFYQYLYIAPISQNNLLDNLVKYLREFDFYHISQNVMLIRFTKIRGFFPMATGIVGKIKGIIT